MAVTGQRNFLSFGDGLHDRSFEKKNVFELFFAAKSKFLVFIFAFFSFYMIFFINKARKLEVAESNPIMEIILISL